MNNDKLKTALGLLGGIATALSEDKPAEAEDLATELAYMLVEESGSLERVPTASDTELLAKLLMDVKTNKRSQDEEDDEDEDEDE